MSSERIRPVEKRPPRTSESASRVSGRPAVRRVHSGTSEQLDGRRTIRNAIRYAIKLRIHSPIDTQLHVLSENRFK